MNFDSSAIIHYIPLLRVGSLEANDEIENWKMRHLGLIWVTRKLLPFDVT